MESLKIISGSPGAGKTALAGRLAAEAPQGAHLVTDLFYRFLARRIDPSTPEAHGQNRTVIRAFSRAASALAEGGYDVILDGIVGPWMLPVLAPEMRGLDIDYVILRTDLATALARTEARCGQASASPEVVAKMHREFSDLGPYEAHVLVTTGRSFDEVAAEYKRRLVAGALRLRVPQGGGT
jgi:predicted kinase